MGQEFRAKRYLVTCTATYQARGGGSGFEGVLERVLARRLLPVYFLTAVALTVSFYFLTPQGPTFPRFTMAQANQGGMGAFNGVRGLKHIQCCR